MRVLLLSMPDVDTGFHPSFMMPPNLGLCSLAGNLDPRHTVVIADLMLKRSNVKAAILEAFAASRPDVVGISAMTFQYHSALQTAKMIKAAHPGLPIALGGYHATIMYKEIADSKDAIFFDLIFRGESDRSFNEALDQIESGGDLAEVRGLSFRRQGRFIHNQSRPLEDLRTIKPPDRSKRLWKGFRVIGMPFDFVETSRGCLMQCNFCNIRTMYGRSFRKFDMVRTIGDIAHCRNQGVKSIMFTDDNITLDIPHLDALCTAIIDAGYNDMVFGIQASPAGIASSPHVVAKMAKAGFKYVYLGIENKSSQGLRQLKKGHLPNDSEKAVRLLRDQRFVISGGMIIGHPEDDQQAVEENISYLKDLRTDYTAVQLLVPYPKTEVREEIKRKGLLVNENDFKRYNSRKACMRTRHLSADQLSYLVYLYCSQYLKPRTTHHLRVLMRNVNLLVPVFGFRAGSNLALTAFRALFENFGNIYRTDRQKYNQYLSLDEKLNHFNI
jgi:anaerobic magnesium-protoporphyrin IX monomethyl ester cyclase